MSHKEAICRDADNYIDELNRLNGRHVDYRDFVFFHVQDERVINGAIELRMSEEPFKSSTNCAWIVLVVSEKPYVVSRSVCLALRREKNDYARVPLSLMTKVRPVKKQPPYGRKQYH